VLLGPRLVIGLVVVVACSRQPETSVVPRFARGTLLEATSDESANASIGDLNGDGNLDILLVKGRHFPFVDRVLFGDGRGAFPAARDLGETPDRSYSGSLVDVDRDGDLDVVISNDSPDPKVVHLNDGTGRFRVGGTYGNPRWPTRNATVADLNGDGLPDIIVANRAGNRPGANFICLNRGAGRFDGDCLVFSRESATTITAADVNRDGFVDLVVPHRDGGQSFVYLHEGKSGDPTFRRVPFGEPRATIRVCGVADFDGDGRLDIAAVDERRGLAVYFGQGGERFSEAVVVNEAPKETGPGGDLPAGAPYALLVADINTDGKPDILVGKVRAPSTIHVNDGSGRAFTPVQLGDSRGATYGFAVGDVNGDGRPDIVVARSGAPNVIYFANR
jgi:hypothetical protein